MATVRDVAKLAGVSVGTVSKVLANDQTVKQVRRERVMEAIRELNYTPNQAARALRTKRANVIGLIVPDITNPFFAQLAKGVEVEASKRGYAVMLANTMDDLEMEEQQIGALLEQSLHGLIVVATNDSSNPALEAPDLPIISLDRRFGERALVSVDHTKSAALAARHLLDLGHRRLAYVSGPNSTDVGRLRREGFIAAIETGSDAGVALEVHEGTFDYASGEETARKILALDPKDRPTAIATGNDQMAIGVLRAANDLGLRVPHDLSVVGFDDIDLAQLVIPRLTTVSQPTTGLSGTAVARLFEPDATGDTLIEGKLVIRGSTAALAQP